MEGLLFILLALSIVCGLIFLIVGKVSFGKALFYGVIAVGYTFAVYFCVGLVLLIFFRSFSRTATANIGLFLLCCGVLIGLVIDGLRTEKAINIEAGHNLPRMRMLAEDVSHFLPRNHRVLSIYYDRKEEAIMAWLYVIDGAEQAELYAVLDNDVALRESPHYNIMRTFYSENYSPSKEGVYCEAALIHGEEMDDVSSTLSYKMKFIRYGGASFSALAKDMKERYPKEFKKDSQTWFTLTFRAQ